MQIKCKAGHQGKKDTMRSITKRTIKKAEGGHIALELAREAYAKDRRDNINGYQLDKSLSNKKTSTYHNPETKQTYIAHKGTNPRDKNDLRNDFLITTGLLNKHTSKRVRNAGKIAKGAQEKYGTNITNVGHSLGGTMAEKTARKLNVENSKAISYNPGMSPLDIPRGIYQKSSAYFNPNSNKTQKFQNVTRHTTGVDPISVSGLMHAGKTVMHAPKSFLNPHGLSNFSKGGPVKKSTGKSVKKIVKTTKKGNSK